MKVIIDNQIAKLLALDDPIIKKHVLFAPDNEIVLKWPSLFEFLGFGPLLVNFSLKPIFDNLIAALHEIKEKEKVFYIYDRLFVECLNQIKDYPQINDLFLIEAIREKNKLNFLPALQKYEVALIENKSATMHDLILYLAWDRVCLYLGAVFDFQSKNLTFIQNLETLKEGLIESYQHIAKHGKTVPGIYRLFESLIFYHMREENIEKHTPIEWAILSQIFSDLKGQQWVDYFYIDDAVMETKESTHCYITLDSEEKVNLRLSFAQCMITKLKNEKPDWIFHILPKNIQYLTFN